MNQHAHDRQTHAGEPAAPAGRRHFLTELLAIICGGLAVLPPLVAGVWAFLSPLSRRGGSAKFLPITELSAIPDDGVPRQFAVIADRVDAWTGFAAEPVGAVYLRREKGSQQVEALSATCPHAGCFVEMEAGGKCFRCPCHNSEFTLDGGIVAPSPSPRAMDALECRVAKNGEVEVMFQKFRAGIAEKVAQQ